MPITATIDARKVITLSGTSAGVVAVSFVGTTLQLASTDNTVNLSVAGGWAGISVANGLTLSISASLADGKAFPGAGNAVAIAAPGGQNLSGLNLFVDAIQLTAGQAYTLTAAQAAIARVGSAGALGRLTSSGQITIVAPEAADLSTLVTDANDVIQLTAGLSYTLTAAQAAVARVGSGGTLGNFASAGAVTIRADAPADLTRFGTDANDTLVLAAGKDYTLTLAQAAIAQVGSGGTKGALGTAGTVVIRANEAGDPQLFNLSATGIDILQLTAGRAYTLTPAQAAISRLGASGVLGDISGNGVITIKADLAPANLVAVDTDSSDIIWLGANLDYTLTTAQAARARVGSGGALGDLSGAGTVVLVANPAGEVLSSLTVQGVDFFELSAGSDYTLTTAQALRARVGSSGVEGDLTLAGHITLRPNAGQDLTTLGSVQGVDSIILAPGGAYTLTPSQARIARIDANGQPGQLGSTGQITVLAPVGADLSAIAMDSGDVLVLSAGQNYTLSTAQALIARVGSPTATPGSLAKAGITVVNAAAAGEDLSGLSSTAVSGIDAIVLAPGQKYTVAPSQAPLLRVGNVSGTLSGAGPLTLRASVGEDFSSSTLANAAASIILSAGQSYTLTASQALVSRIGAGALGDLRQPTGSTGAITVQALSGTANLSALSTDGNVSFLVDTASSYTLTSAQALNTRTVSPSGVTSAPGDLSAGGVFTINATAGGDLSALVLGTGDQLQLAAGRNYTLASHQVPLAQVGSFAPGDLAKAGQVLVRANPAGEDFSSIANFAGIDGYLLTAGAAYTLTASQAAISRVGTAANAVPGVLASTAKITIKADAAADLSNLVTDSGDEIWLLPSTPYTLTTAQAPIARILDANQNPGPLGLLNSSGTISVRANSGTTLEDLTPLASVEGIDQLLLSASTPYRLTAAQADIARVGSGAAGNLSGTGLLTIVAEQGRDLTGIRIDATDTLLLTEGQGYTLTAAQAASARVGSATAPAGTLTSSGVIRIVANSTSAAVNNDLSRLVTDANDVILLSAGQRYTLTTAQAATARVVSGGTESLPGALTNAGMVRLLAGTAPENLTGLRVDSGDVIQLTAGTAYTLTDLQAAISQMGASGTFGNLTSAGAITVVASSMSDLTGIQLDTVNDRIVLNGAANYTLTSTQAPIAQIDTTGTPGELTGTGVITLRASRTGEDLATTALQGVRGLDSIVLWPSQNYTLTAEQIAVARVAPSNTLGNFSAAGVVTVRGSASGENLTALAAMTGIDGYVLSSGVNYTLTAAQAAVARMATGAAAPGPAGQLLSGGAITVVATQSTDLSRIALDAGDTLHLSPGQNYTITPVQAGIARVVDPNTGPGSAGALGPAGTVTLQANPLGEDLSLVTATGIDSILLAAGRNYTLSAAQASMAMVPGGTPGQLTKAGTITIRGSAAGENLSTSLTAVGVDAIQLNPDVAYTLTAAQAAMARIGQSGATGQLTSGGTITVVATQSTDLTRLGLDAGDAILLSTGSTYKLTPLQANIARYTGGAVQPGSLADVQGSPATSIHVIAARQGDDLTRVTATGVDNYFLTAGAPYTLTSAQAAVSIVGTGSAGLLSKAGSITLRSSSSEVFTTTQLNNLSVDAIQLTGVTGSNFTSVQYTIPLASLSQIKLQVGAVLSGIYTPLALAVATDTDGSDGVIGSSDLRGVSSTALDYLGEWTFNTSTGLLQVFDGTNIRSIQLIGVTSIVTDGSTVFTGA